ncbi:MAG TPA: PAS domain-containing protein [Tabrizicola sp.]|nr:PAS domain-containing protein [Tabrizicola sp.]
MGMTFLDRFCKTAAPRQPLVIDGLAQVRAYWEGLRRTDRLPGREELDPRGLSGMLDRVFLAERIGQGLARVRIAGSCLTGIADGTDLCGLPLSCLFAAESRPLLAQSVERVFSEPAIAEIDLGSDRGRAGVTIARMLLLPLADDAGAKILLGAVGFASDPGHACKFQLLARREERTNPPRHEQPVPVFAPEEAVQPLLRRGHLTLVHVSA